MTSDLPAFDRNLCNLLQQGLPLCQRPFAEIAKALNTDEKEVLQRIRTLKSQGLIRRIGAILNFRAIGFAGTLAMAHVPQENLDQVSKAVNALPGVSHNYLRDHHYNLWFTLQVKTSQEIDSTLSNLSRQFGIDFHSLPAIRIFKLEPLANSVQSSAYSEQRTANSVQRVQIPKTKVVKLNDVQKKMLVRLQDDMVLAEKPFARLCSEDLNEEDVLATINELVDKGVIRRIAAVVDHRKLGFVANALFVCEVPPRRVSHTGQVLTQLPIVSHCYERVTFEGWPYNLFAMMHARSIDEIQITVSEFTKAEKIGAFALLPTMAELKKQPIRYEFS